MDKSTATNEHRALCAILRQLRESNCLSQRELADVLNMPQSFVSKYETGERRLDLIELREICAALSITLADLVRRFEERVGK